MNQMPYGMPGQNFMPMPTPNFNQEQGNSNYNFNDQKLSQLEQKINNIDTRLKNIEKKMDINSASGFNNSFGYQSSMYMM